MRHLLGLLLLPAVMLAASSERVRMFEQDPTGSPPKGFGFHVAREAAPDKWAVVRDADTKSLAHNGDTQEGRGFALAVLDGPQYDNVTVSTRLKFVAGARSGGIVWRFQDSRNYYLARVDLGDQEVALFRVVEGNRIRIKRDDDLEVERDGWHTLKVIQKDEGKRIDRLPLVGGVLGSVVQREVNIRVYLDGIKVLSARDHTFRNSGAAGVWSTGSSVIYFHDVRVQDLDE